MENALKNEALIRKEKEGSSKASSSSSGISKAGGGSEIEKKLRETDDLKNKL